MILTKYLNISFENTLSIKKQRAYEVNTHLSNLFRCFVTISNNNLISFFDTCLSLGIISVSSVNFPFQVCLDMP